MQTQKEVKEHKKQKEDLKKSNGYNMPNDGFEPEQANMSVSQDPHHTRAKLQ